MGLKQSNNGQFQIPTAPSAGTAVAQSSSANTFGSYVQMTASTSEADYILGVRYEATTTQVPTYLSIQIGTGAGGSETTVCIVDCPIMYTVGATGTQIGGYIPLQFPVPVANATRIAVKTASSVASAVSWNISLTVMKQADLVDMAIAETSNITQIDGNATNGNNATLNLKQLNVTNSAGDAIVASSTGSNGRGINATGNGSGAGLRCVGGSTGHGVASVGGSTSGDGMNLGCNGGGNGLTATATGAHHGAAFTGGNPGGSGLYLQGTTTGNGLLAQAGATGTGGIFATGGATSGSAFYLSTTSGDCISINPTAGHGINTTGNGTGNHGILTTGAAASGAAAGGDGIRAVGGASTTTSGGTAGKGIYALGGAGSASTNGAATGVRFEGGGTTTVTGGRGLHCVGTGSLGDLDINTNGLTAPTTTAQIGVNTVQIAGSATASTNLSNTYAAFETGTAQAGGASSITLRSGASSVDNFYKDQVVFLLTNTGSGQTNRITAYNGSTKIATVETVWVTQPDNTTTYLVVGRVG